MRLRCVADGDILDDWSGTTRRNIPDSCGRLSMARHYENGYRLPHLPPGWLRQIELNDVINSRSRNSSIAYTSFSCKQSRWNMLWMYFSTFLPARRSA